MWTTGHWGWIGGNFSKPLKWESFLRQPINLIYPKLAAILEYKADELGQKHLITINYRQLKRIPSNYKQKNLDIF